MFVVLFVYCVVRVSGDPLIVPTNQSQSSWWIFHPPLITPVTPPIRRNIITSSEDSSLKSSLSPQRLSSSSSSTSSSSSSPERMGSSNSLKRSKRISHTISDEENLLSYLFVNYNPSARPVLNSSDTVFVNLKFSLLQIQELNVRSQILTSTGFLILEWRDERLTWPRDISGLDEVVVKGENIWKPEFAVINGAESIYGEYVEFQATLRADGFIRWEPGGIFKTMCGIDITFYPFDTQRCEIKFGAWSYHTTKMNLTTDEENIRIDAYEKNGEWQVMDTGAQRNEFAFECCPSQRFSFISFAVELRRRQTFYVMNVIVPGLLTSAVLLSLFYCVPSQKVHIGVAALLSFRLFLVNVADTVPRTSDHIPLLGIYLTCTMAITTLAMVATVLVGNLYERKDRPVPKWLKTLMMEHVARILCMSSSGCRGEDGHVANEKKKHRQRSLSLSWCCLDSSMDGKERNVDERCSDYLKEDEELRMMATYDPRNRRTNVKAYRTAASKSERGRLKDSQSVKINKMSRSKSFDIGSALSSIAIKHVNDAKRQKIAQDKSSTFQRQKQFAPQKSPASDLLKQDQKMNFQSSTDGEVIKTSILKKLDSLENAKDQPGIDSNRNIDRKNLSKIVEEINDNHHHHHYQSIDPDKTNNLSLIDTSRDQIDRDDSPRAVDVDKTFTSETAKLRHRRSPKLKAPQENETSPKSGGEKSSLDAAGDDEQGPANYSKDWAHLAAVCDRFFFWLCLFFILGTTLLLFHPLTTSRFFKIPVIDKP